MYDAWFIIVGKHVNKLSRPIRKNHMKALKPILLLKPEALVFEALSPALYLSRTKALGK
jgi:hypothetical protein